MADNTKPSLASFTDAVNKELQKPNAQKSVQNSIEQLSPVGSFKSYNFNRNDAIRYDDPELGYLPFRNNENLYGEYQSTAEKWGAGLTKFAGKTGTAVIGNLGGMVYGIGSAISNGEINKIFDNDVTRKLDQWDQNMDEEYANYYTDAEKNAGLLGRMGTANFWSDKVLGGASFMAGAIISEAVTSAITAGTFGAAGAAQVGLTARILDKGRKLFKYTSKLDDVADVAAMATRGAIRGADDVVNVVKNAATNAPKISEYVDDAARMSNNVFDNAVNTVSKANALNRIGTYARQTVFATGFEAGVEAMHHGQEFRNDMIKNYENTFGVKADKKALDEINNLAKSSEVGVFATNLALLSITNAAQFKEFSYGVRDLMSIGRKSGAKVATKDILEETTEEGLKKFIPGFEKWGALRKAASIGWAVAKNPIMEGPVEEGLQGVINNSFHEYNLHKYNPTGMQSAMDLSTALGHALTKQYGTVDGWEENIIGMVLGGAGIPLIKSVRNEDGTKSWKLDVTGGIADELRERREKREDITNRAAFLQKTHDAFVTTDANGKSKFDTIKFTNAVIQNSVESASILQQRDGFVNAGDFKRAKDSDADLAFSYFKARYDTGRFESTLDGNIEMIEKMTPEEFGEQFQYDPNMSTSDLEKRKEDTLKSFKNEANLIKSALKQTDSILPEGSENLRAGIAHAIYRGKNAESRIQGISEKISFLTNNAINKDTLSKALNNQYDFASAAIADPNVSQLAKQQAVNDYDKAKQLIKDLDRLEQQYNAPVLPTKDEAQLEKNLAMRTDLENQMIAKKEEYLELGKKYSAQFRVIKDINDVRLKDMIGNMKAYEELDNTVKGYVDAQGENSVEVQSLHKDLTKLLADKVNFTRLYNYLFTKKGQEEFENTDKSVKNALTQDYVRLANKYNALNSSLAEEEFNRNVAAQTALQQRVFERLAYEAEQAELNGEEYNTEENGTRIYKEEYHRQRNAFLSDKYYDQALDEAESSKTFSYSGRLLNKGNMTNFGSFAESLKDDNKDETKDSDVKTPDELNEEIAKENKEIDDVSKETGKNLNNIKALNRSIQNANNSLVKHKIKINNDEDTTESLADLKSKLKVLKDNFELVTSEFDEILDKNKTLDPTLEKVYTEYLDKADDLINKITETLLEENNKTKSENSTEPISEQVDVDDDVKTITEYPTYFTQLFRGTEKSPIDGIDFNVNKADLVSAWDENRVVVRKRKLETPVNINANKYIKRKQDFSYDVIIKNADGSETFVGVMSTPNSFVFVQPNGKQVPIDFRNVQHIKAFNSDFLDDTNNLNDEGLSFQEHGYDISDWENKYLIPLEENAEIGTEQLKEVMDNITRNTFMSFSSLDEKPQLANTNTLRNFEQNAINISNISVKPRYASRDTAFEDLSNIKGMYVLDSSGVILLTKNEDGTYQEWNIKDASILRDNILKNLDSDQVDKLKQNGTDKFLICSPLGDTIMPIGLMGPSFNGKISLVEGINKLKSIEDLENVELNKTDQGEDEVTGVNLGDGFIGVILPNSQRKNNEKGLPTPIVINLTSSSSEFISEAYMDSQSSESPTPSQAYIPIIPKKGESKLTKIGYKIFSSIEKNYTLDEKTKEAKPFYKLKLNVSKNTDKGPQEFTLSFFLNVTKTNKLLLTFSDKNNKSSSVEVDTLDDCLTVLYRRPPGSSKTILETHIENDKYFAKPENNQVLDNIKSLITKFNIGFNSKLNKTVLRKFANNVEENLAAGESGGRIEFTKKKTGPPKKEAEPTAPKPPVNSSGRRSRRSENSSVVSSVSATTPFQDFITNEFKSYIDKLVSTYSDFYKKFTPSKIAEIRNMKNAEERDAILGSIIQELSFLPKLDLSRYIEKGSSEFLKMLNNGPRKGEVLDTSRVLFSMIVHTVPEVGMVYNNIDYLLKDIEADFGAYSFDSPQVQTVIKSIKDKFNIPDVSTQTKEEDLGEGRAATASDLDKAYNNAPRNEEGTPIITNEQPPTTQAPVASTSTSPLMSTEQPVSTNNAITPVPENIIQSSPNRRIDFNDSVSVSFNNNMYTIQVAGFKNDVTVPKDKIISALSKIGDTIDGKFYRTEDEKKISDDINNAKKTIRELVIKKTNIFAMNDTDLEAMKGSEIKNYCNI